MPEFDPEVTGIHAWVKTKQIAFHCCAAVATEDEKCSFGCHCWLVLLHTCHPCITIPHPEHSNLSPSPANHPQMSCSILNAYPPATPPLSQHALIPLCPSPALQRLPYALHALCHVHPFSPLNTNSYYSYCSPAHVTAKRHQQSMHPLAAVFCYGLTCWDGNCCMRTSWHGRLGCHISPPHARDIKYGDI